MTKKEQDKIRNSVLYQDERLKVICTANYGNFPKGVEIEARSRAARKSGLKYPEPKWTACDYYITDSEGDSYRVSRERYGLLEKGFEWVV